MVVAGPCAVESEKQALDIARHVRAAGATLYRGGAFKPRTSPYSFQGLGEEGLKILARVREETGLPIVTEVLDTENAELVAEYADCLQIGARNMQNFALLKKVGRMRKPVLLKRGMSATIEELLLSAEYLLSEGNYEVMLCERGVRTFANHTRNTLDLSVIPYVKRISHLPILVDPSHGTGKRHEGAADVAGRDRRRERRAADRGARPSRARALRRAAGSAAGHVRPADERGAAARPGGRANRLKGLLVLEDGSSWRGEAIGRPGTSFGEIVFNTAMSGYQEVLTDPSYAGQIVVMTAAHVGNYGVRAVGVRVRPRARGRVPRP